MSLAKGYNGGEPFEYSQQELDSTPNALDWRLYGAVTPVKDQASCGSCWSFGTVGTLEGANFLQTGQLVRFSQQALMDCSWGFGNNVSRIYLEQVVDCPEFWKPSAASLKYLYIPNRHSQNLSALAMSLQYISTIHI